MNTKKLLTFFSQLFFALILIEKYFMKKKVLTHFGSKIVEKQFFFRIMVIYLMTCRFDGEGGFKTDQIGFLVPKDAQCFFF